MQLIISSRYNQFIKDNLVLEEFDQRHSMDIFCPKCGKSIRVTEWTTDTVCSCGRKLDALEILFESFSQIHSTKDGLVPAVPNISS